MVGAEVDGLHGAVVGAVFSNAFNCIFTWIVLVWAARRVVAQPEPTLPQPDPSLAA
jgi:uncharacterized iron-regulated membrane protein